MARKTKKTLLKAELTKLKIKYFKSDNTVTLQERLDAHNEKRPFKKPLKAKSPFKKNQTKKDIKTVIKKAQKLKPGRTIISERSGVDVYQHENGRLYKFRPGRTHAILKGNKYSISEALKNKKVMKELVNRNFAGLVRVN